MQERSVMKKLMAICIAAGLMVFATSVVYALPSDNFDDNSMDTSMWILYQESPSVWFEEINQRLETRSTGDAGNTMDMTANYVANGWGLSTAEDFSFKVDFHVSSLSGSGEYEYEVVLGLVEFGDMETMINNGAAIGAEFGDFNGSESPFFWCDKTTNGITTSEGQKSRSLDDGTLYVSYDTAADELYMSDTGYWAANNPFVTIHDLLQGEWGGGTVCPVLSGDASNIALASGDDYLDNFVVDSGTIVLVPEPATICLLAIGSLALIRKKK